MDDTKENGGMGSSRKTIQINKCKKFLIFKSFFIFLDYNIDDTSSQKTEHGGKGTSEATLSMKKCLIFKQNISYL